MLQSHKHWSTFAVAALWLTTLGGSGMVAQAQSTSASAKKSSSTASPITAGDAEATREELIRLLRMSPKLTSVVGRDPSLLADEAYVGRNNPELAQFLRNHPEVVRNPEFYLFFPPDRNGRGRRQLFETSVWPELRGPDRTNSVNIEPIVIGLVIISILSTLFWGFRILLENTRWRRLSKIQSDLYNKLLDKCGTNEELLALIRTDAGKPFFEIASNPLSLESRAANTMTRVFLPLQLGIVLTLAGAGFLYLRNSIGDNPAPFLVLGTLALTVGIGFILSAGASFALARHLGLLPQTATTAENGAKFGPSN